MTHTNKPSASNYGWLVLFAKGVDTTPMSNVLCPGLPPMLLHEV